MADDVLSGAAQGAAKGFAAGGPVGALLGGALGAIGGIFSNKSKKYKRKANKEEQRMIEINQSMQRRQIVRSIFLARQEALAAGAAQESGGLQSSAVQGALSSVSSQGISNLKTFDALVARDIMRQYYMKKAGKNAGYAGLANGAFDLFSSMPDLFSFGGTSVSAAGNARSAAKTASGGTSAAGGLADFTKMY